MNTKLFYLDENDFDYLIQMLVYQSNIQQDLVGYIQQDNDRLNSLIKELEMQAQ